MKIFRYTNGFLYSIEQIGRGRTITKPKDFKCFQAVQYKTNKNAPALENLGETPNLENFTLVFEA